jgi:dipeptidyl aminopeptidase/acylaminoacyl peptidase
MEGENSYGDSWFAYLIKPYPYVPGSRYPLVVTTYRSGDYFLRGASGDESPIQVYAAHGFVVLCFDVGRPRNFAAGDFPTKLLDWASPTASIQMAVERLIREGIVDPDRIGISGFSHGEEIVGYAVTHSKLFRAAIGAAGYDPSFYYLAGNRWRALFSRWGLDGWPDGDSRRRWQEIAMPLRANLVDTAVLENASDSEYLTYLPRVIALEELSKPVELHIYPYELHVRNQPRHKYEIYSRNLDWFRFWLKSEEELGADRADDVRRWKGMRDRHRAGGYD